MGQILSWGHLLSIIDGIILSLGWCVQVEQCMHQHPRTCTADMKAVDALQVSWNPVLAWAALC